MGRSPPKRFRVLLLSLFSGIGLDERRKAPAPRPQLVCFSRGVCRTPARDDLGDTYRDVAACRMPPMLLSPLPHGTPRDARKGRLLAGAVIQSDEAAEGGWVTHSGGILLPGGG